MEKRLTLEEQPAFREISFSIGDEAWHTIDEIRGVPIPKDAIPMWMKVFVERGFYVSTKEGNETKYQITGKGLHLFSKIREKAERDAQPVPFQYPKGFKPTKSSYY